MAENKPKHKADDLDRFDQVTGHICTDCRLVWVEGTDARELGLMPETSSTLNASTEAFVSSTKHLDCAGEEDTANGYFDCLFCNDISICGYAITVYMVP